MYKFLSVACLLMMLGLLVGCDRAADEAVVVAVSNDRAIGTATRPLASESSLVVTPSPEPFPILLSIALPSPLQTPEAPTLPLLSYDRPPEATAVPAASLLMCTPRGEVVDCDDELLDLRFSYPAFMGSIRYTDLRRGGYAGFGYEYIFEESYYRASAGGRSRDFGEGRGPMYTDQSGFNGRSPDHICAEWRARRCQALAPGVLLLVMVPQSQWFCREAIIFTEFPRALLILDLPNHPLINGFGFSTLLITPETETAWREKWYGGALCDPASQVEFDAQMEQLLRDLEAGTAEPEIQTRYDAMIRLAESLESGFLDKP